MKAKCVHLIVLSILLNVGIGCAPTLKETFKKVEGTPENKGLVYIYRTSGLGGLVYYDVKANGRVVTTLNTGTYYPYVTDPGRSNSQQRLRRVIQLPWM
ncbi:MAG TPA: hypothetical protein VKB81_07845 [Nitrospira sp.]|nr:hypothetical protein [Nitrospira sp.]